MAKTKRARTAEPVSQKNAATDMIAKLKASTQRALSGIKGQWNEYAKAFAVMTQKRSDLAEPLMKLYGACLSDLGRLTFVNFLRMIDPTMPANRDEEEIGGKIVAGYRTHPTYQAGLYLQRLTTTGQGGRARGGARGINAVDRMARVLATMIPLVADEAKFWQAVAAELQIDGAALTRLQNKTKETEPLIKLPTLRSKFPVKVIHIARPATEQPQSRAA